MITLLAVLVVVAVPVGFGVLWLRSERAQLVLEANVHERFMQLGTQIEELRIVQAQRDAARAELAHLRKELAKLCRRVAVGDAPAKEEPDPDDDDAETRVYARKTLTSITSRPS